MKEKTLKVLSLFFIFLFFLLTLLSFLPQTTLAADSNPVLVLTPTPEPCPLGNPAPNVCPPGSYGCGEKDQWVRDYEVEALGKGGERSRQFLSWVLTHPSIDNHPTLLSIWRFSRNVVYFLLLITAIFMGIGIIIGQRNNFDLKVSVAPLLIKLFLLLLYTTFSATIVLLIIQTSDIMMQFFIKRLGADKLFNIFFLPGGGSSLADSEESYRSFYGCRNLNPEHLEMYRTSLFLIRFTNMTYYVIGIMLILRKIILWFLLIVSPFLAILMPYVFIRNIGWIWIGVFFQWVFYGPLFALFLGGLANIWSSVSHIPYIFDFSRAAKGDWVYPTVIRILYGGPAQELNFRNSANYVDTFAEYIISLIMLWTVIFLPWWLLRIFRDYCCEGIYAMKNILLSMYDSFKSGGLPPIHPVAPTPAPTAAGLARKIPEEREIVTKIKLETIEEIKRTKTEDIHRVMNISVQKLTDIAHFETNKQLRETVTKNIEYLQNPIKAETPTERQRFMNIRSELFDRAIKGDALAKQTLASISSSQYERISQQEKILKSLPQMVPIVKTTSVKVGLPVDKTTNILNSVLNSLATNTNVVNNISSQTNISSSQVQTVVSAMSNVKNLNQPAQTLINNIAQQAGVDKEKVKQVIERTAVVVKEQKDLLKQTAEKEGVNEQVVEKVLESHLPVIVEPEKHIEETVTIPPTVSIEDYEEVKNMWVDQYEKGEIPISENIKDRGEWVKNDIIAITNILNKILSPDEKLKAEGLEEVGYILPLFMINNLSGEELVVYLRAKLEAAKQVNRELEKEKEAREKAKAEEKEEEVLVEAPKKAKKEEEKAMEMEEELEVKN